MLTWILNHASESGCPDSRVSLVYRSTSSTISYGCPSCGLVSPEYSTSPGAITEMLEETLKLPGASLMLRCATDGPETKSEKQGKN